MEETSVIVCLVKCKKIEILVIKKYLSSYDLLLNKSNNCFQPRMGKWQPVGQNQPAGDWCLAHKWAGQNI